MRSTVVAHGCGYPYKAKYAEGLQGDTPVTITAFLGCLVRPIVGVSMGMAILTRPSTQMYTRGAAMGSRKTSSVQQFLDVG